MLSHLGRRTEGEWPTNEIVDEGVTVHLAHRMGQKPSAERLHAPVIGNIPRLHRLGIGSARAHIYCSHVFEPPFTPEPFSSG